MTAVTLPTRGDDPINRLLPRLERVQRRGADRWSARCPAHDDKGPSLSLRVLPDGRVLLHCFAGCPPAEVVHAVGLELHDLFPKPQEHHRPGERRPWRDAGPDALRALADEVNHVFVCAALMAGGVKLTARERDRLAIAAERVNGALHLIDGGPRHG